MAKDRSLVRASDIGSWSFCSRSWWLAVVQDAQHADPSILARGTESHAAHGRLVARSSRLQRAGLALIFMGLLAIALILVWFLLAGG